MHRLHAGFALDGRIHLFELDETTAEGVKWDAPCGERRESEARPYDAALRPLLCRVCYRWREERESVEKALRGGGEGRARRVG